MAVTLRPAEALHLWKAVSAGTVGGGKPDLSMRQMAILLIVYLDPPPHTVRGLAESLGVGKPVISRALDSLGALDLLTRRRDMADRRSVLVRRTVTGALYVESFGDAIIAAARTLPT